MNFCLLVGFQHTPCLSPLSKVGWCHTFDTSTCFSSGSLKHSLEGASAKLLWLGTLPFFFSVQRLHGFRQVVTHIQSRQPVELKFTCRAVNLSKATKVLVVDQYAVQKLSPQENRQESKPKATKQKQAKNTQPQPNQNKNDTEKWDRHQPWKLHAK